jgi:hypothetical protein
MFSSSRDILDSDATRGAHDFLNTTTAKRVRRSPRRRAAVYLSAVATSLKTNFSLVAMLFNAAIIATATKLAINAYSIAVAALSSARNFVVRTRILRSFATKNVIVAWKCQEY